MTTRSSNQKAKRHIYQHIRMENLTQLRIKGMISRRLVEKKKRAITGNHLMSKAQG